MERWDSDEGKVGNLPDLLCPLCTRQGGLSLDLEAVPPPGLWIPVLSCSMPKCRLILVGTIDPGTGDAVFPDPHVEVSR